MKTKDYSLFYLSLVIILMIFTIIHPTDSFFMGSIGALIMYKIENARVEILNKLDNDLKK